MFSEGTESYSCVTNFILHEHIYIYIWNLFGVNIYPTRVTDKGLEFQ